MAKYESFTGNKKVLGMVRPDHPLQSSIVTHSVMNMGKASLVGLIGIAFVGLGLNYFTQRGIGEADAATYGTKPTRYMWVNGDSKSTAVDGEKNSPFKTLPEAIVALNALSKDSNSKSDKVKVFVAATSGTYSICQLPTPTKGVATPSTGLITKNNVEILGVTTIGSTLKATIECSLEVQASGFRIDNFNMYNGSVVIGQSAEDAVNKKNSSNATISRIKFINGSTDTFVKITNYSNITIRNSAFQFADAASDFIPNPRVAIRLENASKINLTKNDGVNFGGVLSAGLYHDIFLSCGVNVSGIQAKSNKILDSYVKYDSPDTCKGKLYDQVASAN